jgi:hypothetical protein
MSHYRWNNPTKCPYCNGGKFFNLPDEIDSTDCPLCEYTGIVAQDLATAFNLVYPDGARHNRATINEISGIRQRFEEMEFNAFIKKALKKKLVAEIAAIDATIDRLRAAMPYNGKAAWKTPIYFVLRPQITEYDSIANSVAHMRAKLECFARMYPQITAYIDAELWRVDAIDATIRLLGVSMPTGGATELHLA